MTFGRILFIGFALFVVYVAHGQDDADLKALQLANQATAATNTPSNWHSFVEGSLGGSDLRSTNNFESEERLSLDIRYDNSFASGWRVVFSDRLDWSRPAQPPGSNLSNAINTMKEAYLNWQPQPDLLFDLGRINEHNGVALGYNPTDYFKTNAIRSIVSIDPKSLKENRQGSVMLRAQKLSDTSSLSVLYSPKLSEHIGENINDAAFSPDFGSTNNQQRWLISYSKKITEGFNPQFLLFKSEQLSTQFGVNTTAVINDATVFFLEWSAGRRPSLLAQSLQQQGIAFIDDSQFRQQLSAGLTYATQNKLSLTAEFEYNGAGQNETQWEALQQGSPLIYGIYRSVLQASLESPTKRSLFVYGSWEDAGIEHLDVNAMARFNIDDASRLTWLELRYHLPQSEYALQWQRYSGTPLSEFGAYTQMQSWALVGRYYF